MCKKKCLSMFILVLLFIFSLCVSGEIDSSSPTTVNYAPFTSIFDRSLEQNCTARCERLFDRSLKRVGYSIQDVAQTLRTKISPADASVICWKYLDYDDCQRQCENANQAETSAFSQDRLFIVRKCTKLISRSPYLKHFQCLHRFHTFLEVRCSSYSKEATRYRYLSKLAKSTNGSSINIDASLIPSSFVTKRPRKMPKNRQMSRETLIQETCRYLHYHSTCLSNAVFNHCPNADDLFNKFTLLDYFLSFVVPQQDQLFSDRLLDYCQMYDFQKIARDLFDSTKTTVKRHTVDGMDVTTQPGIHVTRPLTLPSAVVTKFKGDKSMRQKSLFSSDEDLAETPPNFYYSSAKYTKSYRDALERLNFYQTTMSNRHGNYAPIDEFDLITQPVPLDFSFETEDERRYSKRTPAPIYLTTRPDSILTETQFPNQQRPRHRNQKGGKKWPNQPNRNNNDGNINKDGNNDKNNDREDEEYLGESDENDSEYSSPILWPQKEADKDYIDEYNANDDGPLFRNERPHIFRIRPYGVGGKNDEEYSQGRQGNNQEPISVTIDHEDGGKVVTRLPYDYAAYDEADDPNDITYPGRKEREETTKSGNRVPSFSDMIRTFVTTALQPTTPHPNTDRKRSDNSLLWLLGAYSLFFLAALLILASLMLAMVIIRRRRRHDYYKTFIVKKSQRF